MNKNSIPAVVVTIIAVIGIVVLAILGKPIPDVLTVIASAGVGVVGGQAIPKAAE